MGDSSDEGNCPPPLYYTMSIPIDHSLKTAYYAYKPSLESVTLPRECARSILADKFIENPRLGTLHDLCVRALIHFFGAQPDAIYEDPLDEILHYDSLRTDLPIENIVTIRNDYYWRRVVMAMSSDKTLAFKKDVNWKSIALSLKFAELLENSPAEFFFIDEVTPIANLIKNFVTELHITKLKPLEDSYFDKFFLSESDTFFNTPTQLSETITTLSTESESELSAFDLGERRDTSRKSDGIDFRVGNEEEGLEENSEEQSVVKQAPPAQHIQKTLYTDLDSSLLGDEEEMMEEESKKFESNDPDVRKLRKLKRKAKAAQLLRRAVREEKKERRHEKLEAKQNPPPPPKKKAEGEEDEEVIIKNVYDIKVEASEPELLANIPDKRNVEKCLERRKKFTYDSVYCHHINLSIVGIFTGMEEFSVTFQPGDLGMNFHPRIFRFSYMDMENLARGLRSLQHLKIFRLHNSELDQRKLQILVNGLNDLHTLEVIDLGYDEIKDYFGYLLYDIIAFQPNLKDLILDYNGLGKMSMHKMARGIMYHKGSQMQRLSLSFNPVTNDGLQELTDAMIATGHFSILNLAGTEITTPAICNALAWGLIHNHKRLRELNLVGVEIVREAGVEILKTLFENYKLIRMDRRNCNLDLDLDEDIEIALQRNNFIVDNPYIHNDNYTTEDVQRFTESIKNPILLKSTEIMEMKKICEEMRPNEFESTPMPSEEEHSRSDLSVEKSMMHFSRQFSEAELQRNMDYELAAIRCLKIDAHANAPVDDFNYLTYPQFKKRCSLPGLEQRYLFIKEQAAYQEKALVSRQAERLKLLFRKKFH